MHKNVPAKKNGAKWWHKCRGALQLFSAVSVCAILLRKNSYIKKKCRGALQLFSAVSVCALLLRKNSYKKRNVEERCNSSPPYPFALLLSV